MLPTPASDRSHLSLSQLLRRLIEEYPGNEIGPADIAEWLNERALAGLLLLFALFNTLPLPPGTTLITGIPVLLLSGQLMLGQAKPWLPQFLRKRTISKAQLGTILGKFLRWEHWIERLFRPRLFQLVDGGATRLIGLVCFLLAVVVELPIPGANQAPSLTIAMFMVAIIYRDGLAVLAALVLTVASAVLASGLIVAAMKAALYIARNVLGF